MSSKADYLKRYLSGGPDDAAAAAGPKQSAGGGKPKKRKKGAMKIIGDNEDIEADLQRLRNIRRRFFFRLLRVS